MSTFLLSKEEQGIVVFHVWKSLKYKTRLVLSLQFIFIGFLIQYFSIGRVEEISIIFIGVLFVLTGNLLLLVKGYNNKINLGGFSAENEWVKTDSKRLDDILSINKKARRWDMNNMDITNAAGFFILLLVILGIVAVSVLLPSSLTQTIIFLNALVLFVPHWLTGVRRITTTPKLVKKIKIYKNVLDTFKRELENEDVDFLVYVRGNEEKLPRDVKMKVKFNNQPEGFLGMYAQISMNDVDGTHYPYFYVVLVAKQKSNMLGKHSNNLRLPVRVISEYKIEGDVEILVIRQYTTKKSGYHTRPQAIVNIFDAGLKNAKSILNNKQY
jgi:hypothetical protein